MRKPIKFGRAITTGLVSSVSSFLIFLMISVLLAQVIVDFLPASRYGILVGILFFGFILATIVTMFTSLLITRETIPRNYIFAGLFISFLINIVLWVVISYIGMLIVYPNSLLHTPLWEVFFIFGEVISTFSIYIIQPDPTWLWFYSVLTYGVIYSFVLYWLKTPYEDIKYKKKIQNKKGLYNFKY